jgi:small subunit ribosomal protein S15
LKKLRVPKAGQLVFQARPLFSKSSENMFAIFLPFSIIIHTFAPDKKDNNYWCLIKQTEMSLTTEKISSVFTEFGGVATNTGSIEGQVALLTERILQISKHLQANKKDFSTQRGLMNLVGQRKSLLIYLQRNNLQGYRALIEKLGLRK